jgi:hypothetical protein
MKEGLEGKEKVDGRKRKERKERVEGGDTLEEPSASASISYSTPVMSPVHRARPVTQACVVGARRHTLSPHPIGVCTSHSGGSPALPLRAILMEARCPPSSSSTMTPPSASMSSAPRGPPRSPGFGISPHPRLRSRFPPPPLERIERPTRAARNWAASLALRMLSGRAIKRVLVHQWMLVWGHGAGTLPPPCPQTRPPAALCTLAHVRQAHSHSHPFR